MTEINMIDQLENARNDLAALESGTATLEQAVTRTEQELTVTRRAARAGQQSFDAVVIAQNRFDASRGLLTSHLEDLGGVTVLVGELEAAVRASDTLSMGREAYEQVRGARTAFQSRAANLEARLSEQLPELRALAQQHEAGVRLLRAALFSAVKQAVPYGDAHRAYGGNRTAVVSPEQASGDAFLSQVSPELTDGFIRSPETLSLSAFPILSLLSANL